MIHTIHIIVQTNTVLRILLLGFLGFVFSMLVTPIYTNMAYRGRWWKKPRTTTLTGEQATVFTSLHAEKHKRNIPTMAGIIFVFSAAVVTLIANLSRGETWLPLAAFVGAGFVGLIDDVINIRGNGLGVAGLPSKIKLLLTTLIALVGGWWFYTKLDVSSIHIPLVSGQLHLGWLIVPLFVLVVVATANAVNMTDGLDGLAGGLAVTGPALVAARRLR